MGEDSKPTKLTDDVENLFDLIKEGASYLLHIYLYFISKSFPLEFIENLFDHHKNSSSYDYSKEGKTYIYRLFNAIFEIEKQIVAMALHYVYSYIPVPFIKSIYDNFCVNNHLECTDVKLKNCKKALINSSKLSKKKRDESKNNDEDDDPVSRPFPSISRNPTPKPGNTVSVPLGILVNSTSQKNSNRNLNTQEYSSVRPSDNFNKTSPIYTSAPSLSTGETLQLSSAIRKPTLLLSPPGPTNDSKGARKKISSENDSPSITHAAKISIAKTNESKSSIQNKIDRMRITADSLSTVPSVPTFENPFEGSRARIPSSSEPHNTFVKPSQIPIKINRTNMESTVNPSSAIREKTSTPSVQSPMVKSSESFSGLSSSNPIPSSTFAKTEKGKNSNTNNVENHIFIPNTFSITPSSVNKSPNSISKDINVPSDITSTSFDPNVHSSTLVDVVLLPSTKSSSPMPSSQKPVDVLEELDTARVVSNSSANNSIFSRTKIDGNTKTSLEMSESLKPSTIAGYTDIEISLSKYLPTSVHNNVLDSEKTKTINQSSSLSESSAKNKINSSEEISESPSQNSKIFQLPSFPAQNSMLLPEKQAEANRKQNSAVVDSVSSAKNSTKSLTVPTTKVTTNPDSFVDLSKVFDPSPTVTGNIFEPADNKALSSAVEANQSPSLDISKIFNPPSAPGDAFQSPNEKSTKKGDTYPIPPTTPPTVPEGLVKIPNPVSDLVKQFDTPSTSSGKDNLTVFPELSAPENSNILELPKNKTKNEAAINTSKLISGSSNESDTKIDANTNLSPDIGKNLSPSTINVNTDIRTLLSKPSALSVNSIVVEPQTKKIPNQSSSTNKNNSVPLPGHSSETSTVSKTKISKNPDPFSDLAKLFDPSSTVPRNIFESSDGKAKTDTGLFNPPVGPPATYSTLLPSEKEANPLLDISKISNSSAASRDILESSKIKSTKESDPILSTSVSDTSPISSTSPSKGLGEEIPNPFSDLAKLFDPSPTSNESENETKVSENPDPFADLAKLFDPSPTATGNIFKAPDYKAQTDTGPSAPELTSGLPAIESTSHSSEVEADQSPLLDISKIFNPPSEGIFESPNKKSTKKADTYPIPPSKVSEGLVTEIPNPFSDIAKLFDTSPTTSGKDNETVFPDLFAPDRDSSKIPELPKNKTKNKSATNSFDLVSGSSTNPLSDISKIFKPSSALGDIFESPSRKSSPSFPNTTPSKVTKGLTEEIPNPFSDNAKLFDTSPTTSGGHNATVFPDPFVPDTSSSKIPESPKNKTKNESGTNTPKLFSGPPNKSDEKSEANTNPLTDMDKHSNSSTSVGKTDIGSSIPKPSKSFIQSNVDDPQTKKSTNQSSLLSQASLKTEFKPSEGSEFSDKNKNSSISHLPSTPALPLSKKQAVVSQKQDTNGRDIVASPGDSTVLKTKVSENPDPFADLAKLLDPSPTVPRNIFESPDNQGKTDTGLFNSQSSPPALDSNLPPTEIEANPLLDISKISESPHKNSTKKADPISSKSVSDTSPISPTTPSEGLREDIPNPFTDLAKLFDPSPTSNETDNATLFPELFPTDSNTILESPKEKTKNATPNNPFELNSGASNESGTKIEENLDPFSDIAKLFNPPQSTSNKSLISDPFASNTTSSKGSSSMLTPKQTLPSPLFPGTSPPTLLNIFQPSNTKTTEKNGESVAPVSKNIFPTVDLGTSMDRTIEQNNKAFEKNMEDFGQSISNVFSGGLNAPKPGQNTI